MKEQIQALDIIIPTCKSLEEVQPLVNHAFQTAMFHVQVIPTCVTNASAAENRNIGLDKAQSPIVIQIDDDITRLPVGWVPSMLAPFASDPRVVMVSARHRSIEGDIHPGRMMGGTPLAPRFAQAPQRKLPTSIVAHRNDGLRFNEDYLGSGFDDDDFCAQLREKYPDGIFVVDNQLVVIHVNEMKNQLCHWNHNKEVFEKKWGDHREFSTEQGVRE